MQDSEGGYRIMRSARIALLFSRIAQVAAIVIPLLVTLDRFRRPFGEKFMFPYLGGSADLWLPYTGAAAITQHLDPYGPLPPELRDPSGWPSTYPPTMLALYVPLVWATHHDIELACQVFYWLNIVALGILALVVWRVSLRLRGARTGVPDSFLLVVIALSLNGLTMFALDRSQSEIINAALCWGAIFLFLRQRQAGAMTLVTFAAAIKGYAVPLGLGLLIAARDRKQFLRGAIAGAAVSLLVTVPVAKYLKHGFGSMMTRTEFFFAPDWYNHSFKYAFYQFAPGIADSSRRVMIALSLAFALVSLWQLLVTVRKGREDEIAFRVITFAGASLSLMCGLPVYSGPYNYVLVLPALLLLSTRFADVQRICALPWKLTVGLGSALILALGLALLLRWPDRQFTLAGVGLVVLSLCTGVLTVATWRPRRRLDTPALSDSVSADPAGAQQP